MNQDNEQPVEAAGASRIERPLRQIIEADDAQALTQEIIEAGRSTLAPHPAEPVADAVQLSREWVQRTWFNCSQDVFAFAEAIVVSRRAAGGEVEGYTLVPIKPTPEMIEAGNNVSDLYRMGRPELWGDVYRAMLCAAPAGATLPNRLVRK